MAVTILLIDDNQDQVTITRKALTRSGQEYHLESAATAKEGLEKIRAGHYDVVLCDYRLPDVSGIDLLKQLKEIGSDCPFIIVTSMGSERVAVEAMKGGAYDYVVKDASYEDVLPEIIRQSLERHREREERRRLEAERNAAIEALQKEKAHLETLNKVMMNREERIVELKHQVNALLEELGRPPQYR